MATIGTFTQTKDGFTGTIRTLALNVKAKIVPDEHKANAAAPDFRVFSGTVDYAEQGIMRSDNGCSSVGV